MHTYERTLGFFFISTFCFVGHGPTTILFLAYVFFLFYQGGKRNRFVRSFPPWEPPLPPNDLGISPRPLLKNCWKAKAFLFVPYGTIIEVIILRYVILSGNFYEVKIGVEESQENKHKN